MGGALDNHMVVGRWGGVGEGEGRGWRVTFLTCISRLSWCGSVGVDSLDESLDSRGDFTGNEILSCGVGE